jgi:hypothetical protein
MNPDAPRAPNPDRRTELPEGPNSTDILRLQYPELDGIIRDITADGKIDKDEVIPYRVTTMRRQSALLIVELQTLDAQLQREIAAKQDTKATVAKIETAVMRLRDNNELIANEIALLRTLQVYKKVQTDYRAAKDKMGRHGHSTVLGTPAITQQREASMDAQMDRLTDLMTKRAAVVNAQDALVDWNNNKVDRNANNFRTAFRLAMGREPLVSTVPPVGHFTDQNTIDLINRENEIKDQLLAEIHYSSPAMVKVETFYRKLGWIAQGRLVLDAALSKEIADFIAAQQAARFGGNAELETAVRDLEAVWKNPAFTVEDVRKGYDKMARKKPESAQLLADQLQSWATQLANSDTPNHESRRDCVAAVHGGIGTMFRLQQVYLREFSGYENYRTYVAGTPATPATRFDEPKGLAQAHRMDAGTRVGEVREALKLMRKTLDPKTTDYIRDYAGRLVVEPGVKMYASLLSLVNDKKYETVPRKGMVEVLKNYDIKTIERLEETMDIYQMFVESPRMQPESLDAIRARMTPEMAQRLQEQGKGLMNMSKGTAENMMKNGTEEERIMLWFWINHKMDTDFAAFDAELGKLFVELEKKGNAEKDTLGVVKEIFEDIQRNWLKYLMIGLAIVAAVLGTYHLAKYPLRRYARNRQLAATREASRTGAADGTEQALERERVREAQLAKEALEGRVELRTQLETANTPRTSETYLTTDADVRRYAERVLRELGEKRLKAADLSDVAIDACNARLEEVRRRGGTAEEVVREANRALDEGYRAKGRPRPVVR